MKANRAKWDILYEILDFVLLNKNVARTSVEGHISAAQRHAKTYFQPLLDRGYMTISTEKHGKQTFHYCNATAAGLELRDKIMRIYELFGGERPIW